MKKLMFSATLLGCVAVSAENLNYAPTSGGTTAKDPTFGYHVYSAENWQTEAGVNKKPVAGDVLVINKNNQMTANPTAQGVRLGGIRYKTHATMNQGQIWIQSGGPGIVDEVTSGLMNWYCGIVLYGSDDFPVVVSGSATWNLQRFFNQGDGEAATMVKRGAGMLAFSDTSNWSPAERATWKKSRLEAGTLKFCMTGSGGKSYDAQMFPVGHELVFADDGTSSVVTFTIDTRDLELKNVTLREDSSFPVPNHAFSSSTSTNVYLRLNGTPGLNPMGFGGRLVNRCGLIWNPTSSDNVFAFSNSVSTTQGGLIVSNGTLRLQHGATFTQLSKLQVAPGATFEVKAGAGSAFRAANLVLEDATAALVVDDALLSFDAATRAGVAIPAGFYTQDNCDWLRGGGKVVVGAALPVQDAWWTNDADHPKSLAAGVQTNWFGAHLTGEAFTLDAGAGASVMLGTGGVDTPGTGTSYVWDWPTYLAETQLWRVQAGDRVTIPSTIDTLGGATWYVSNATNGTLALDGTKSFAGSMVVSNGWLEAKGDDALGTAGTTTFEMQSTTSKGMLRLKPADGATELNIRRNLKFHYYKCGEWGDFLALPANTTVNFHGRMETSSAGCVGNSWPCHWRYTCPHSTTVNWYGVMHAALNHEFPDGVHNVWRPLSGGDRLGVGANATLNLYAVNNSIGASSGTVSGRINTWVPYAIDARSANRLVRLTSTGVIDLHGNDQALSILACNTTTYNGATVTSATPALMRISGGNHVIDNNPGITITNFVKWTGCAGVEVVRWADTYPFVLRNTSTSTGRVKVSLGILKFAAPTAEGKWAGKWPNVSEVLVSGGKLVLEHSEPFGTNTVVKFEKKSDGTYGKISLQAGVKVKVPSLVVDGVEQRWGIYGSSASGAPTKRDDLFEGEGILRVGGGLASVLILR